MNSTLASGHKQEVDSPHTVEGPKKSLRLVTIGQAIKPKEDSSSKRRSPIKYQSARGNKPKELMMKLDYQNS